MCISMAATAKTASKISAKTAKKPNKSLAKAQQKKSATLAKKAGQSVDLGRLVALEDKINQLVANTTHHSEELEDHREEISIYHSQTQIFDQLVKTFEIFTSSLRFVTFVIVFVIIAIAFASYVAWNDIRDVPSSLSIIGREVRFATGNDARDTQTCNDMQQQAIQKTQERAGELVESIGARETISTEILILSDCVKHLPTSVLPALDESTEDIEPPLAELITSIQVTIEYR